MLGVVGLAHDRVRVLVVAVMGLQAAADQILTFTDEDEVGGQTFNKFPENDAEAAEFWSEVWFELVKDLAAPVVVIPPDPSKEAWASAMEPLIPVPVGGLAAFDAAALAAFPLLAASIAPNLIAVPPPAPLLALITAALAPFIIGTTDPVGPAVATAGAFKAYVETAQWTPPGPPAPVAFSVAP